MTTAREGAAITPGGFRSPARLVNLLQPVIKTRPRDGDQGEGHEVEQRVKGG